MAVEKSAFVAKKTSRNPILESLNFLFYVSKVFGMIPYSMRDYITKKQFKLSQFGNIFSVLSCIHYLIHYHLVTESTMLGTDPDNPIGALTLVIGLFIIYMEPFMMAIDVVASLINQNGLITIFDRLRDIDDKLAKENISLNYKIIGKYSIIFMIIAFVGELTLALFNLYDFHEKVISFHSLWFLISSVPLFTNSVAKVWFLILILLVQQRLQAINVYLNDIKKSFFEKKMRHVNAIGSTSKKDNLFLENIGYLEREIFSTRNMKIKSDNWVWASGTNRVNDLNQFATKTGGIINVVPYESTIKKGKILIITGIFFCFLESRK